MLPARPPPSNVLGQRQRPRQPGAFLLLFINSHVLVVLVLVLVLVLVVIEAVMQVVWVLLPIHPDNASHGNWPGDPTTPSSYPCPCPCPCLTTCFVLCLGSCFDLTSSC